MAPPRNGVRIQAEEPGQGCVASVPQPDRLQAGEEAALLLVKQTVEEQNGGLEFVGRNLESGCIGYQRHGARRFSGAKLIPGLPAIGGGVQEASGDFGAAETSRVDQLEKRIMDLSMECTGEFVGEPSVRGLIDEDRNGGDERAVTRKPNRIVRPQASVVEAGCFPEGIVAAAVRVAGQLVEQLELAKDSDAGGSAEGLLEFGQGGDLVAEEVLAEGLGIEGRGSHNDIVPSERGQQSEL